MNSTPGVFLFDDEDGALVRVSPSGRADVNALLGEDEGTWHHPPRRWGKGFVVTSRGAARWHRPQKIEGRNLTYPLERAGVCLEVRRTMDGSGLEESYTLTNTTLETLRVGCVGISTPFRDVYPSAKECLRGAFHAHVWTGGANSWVWAAPMNGSGPGLGLDLLEGTLSAYSVENRDHFISSNIRGHLYLHVTDHARNPVAFGGQPEIRLESGGSLVWRWRLGWQTDFQEFQARRSARNFSPERLTAAVGERLALRVPSCRAVGGSGLEILAKGGSSVEVTASEPGIHWVEAGEGNSRSRAALLFHRSVEEITRRRARKILSSQQVRGGEPTQEGAFLCLDNRLGLTELTGAWGDWSDGRERLGMPILIQEALVRRWVGAEAEEALERFRAYALNSLVTEEHEVRGGGYERSTQRLYNYPWMSEFFFNEHRRTGRVEDLRMAADILARYYTKGGGGFFAFLHGIRELIQVLTEAGEADRAARLRADAIAHARALRDMGEDLPNHEVNYEQSIVAPMVILLATAQKLLPDEDWSVPIRRSLAWLRAFEGEQPDARVGGIPIRHWDGFWFGLNRQWGDVFPHHWSVLSAAAYVEAAPLCPDMREDLLARANRIFRANLFHFQEDGSASCAFVYPSCVNGQPAHHADPLANDQDWALVWLLRCEDHLPWMRVA